MEPTRTVWIFQSGRFSEYLFWYALQDASDYHCISVSICSRLSRAQLGAWLDTAVAVYRAPLCVLTGREPLEEVEAVFLWANQHGVSVAVRSLHFSGREEGMWRSAFRALEEAGFDLEHSRERLDAEALALELQNWRRKYNSSHRQLG